MDSGASIRISPSWVPGTTIVDIRWDTKAVASDPRPEGPWFGEFALLGGTGEQSGVWEWDRTLLELELCVVLPTNPPVRHIVGTLSDFEMPALNGTAGQGSLTPGIAPVAGLLNFDWKVAAIV
jgi:hypothetical protein